MLLVMAMFVDVVLDFAECFNLINRRGAVRLICTALTQHS